MPDHTFARSVAVLWDRLRPFVVGKSYFLSRDAAVEVLLRSLEIVMLAVPSCRDHALDPVKAA